MSDSTDVSRRRRDAASAPSAGAAGRMSRRRRVFAVVIALAVAVVVAFGWELAARRGWIDPFFLSKPSAVVVQLFDWWRGGTSSGPLAAQIGITIGEAALGLVLGSAAGGVCGIVFAGDTLRGEVFRLFVGMFKPAARIALGAALALGFGIGIASKIAFAAVLVFFVAFADALAHRPALANLRKRFALALVGAVIGECFFARAGLGFLLAAALHHFNASGVYAALVVLAIVALAADGLLALVETWWSRRRPESEPAAGT